MLLDKRLMTWTFEGAICELKKTIFFFGSDQLRMTEIKSEWAYSHIGAWYVITQSKWN